MVDIIDMKHRVAAAKARFRASSTGEEDRGRKLLHLLEALERKFSRLREENQALREAEANARDETRQLRNLLQDVLNLAEANTSNRPGLPQDQLEQLIASLNQIAASRAASRNGAPNSGR
jgi:septation ring formation regulator EzrA